MKNKVLIAQMLAAGITCSGTLALTWESGLASGTTFECILLDNEYVTVGTTNKGERTEPLIIWRSEAFKPEFEPQERCQTVTEKLNKVVASVGGYFSDVLLTTGTVKGDDNKIYGAICWVNNEQQSCNPDRSNLLVTISPGKDPGKFLGSLLYRRSHPFETEPRSQPAIESVPRVR